MDEATGVTLESVDAGRGYDVGWESEVEEDSEVVEDGDGDTVGGARDEQIGGEKGVKWHQVMTTTTRFKEEWSLLSCKLPEQACRSTRHRLEVRI